MDLTYMGSYYEELIEQNTGGGSTALTSKK